MSEQETTLERITHRLSTISLVMSAGLLFFLRPLAIPGLKAILRLIKLISTAFSRVTRWTGLASAVLGLIIRSPTAFIAGLISYIVSTGYYHRLPAPPSDEVASINPSTQQITHNDQQRIFTSTSPIIHRSVPFTSIVTKHETTRKLLCDVWLPPDTITRSETVFINYHGGAWHSLNKGFLTGTQFRHLTTAGYCVVDVAYRLYPETDMRGMLDDVQRAIAWVQEGGGYEFNAKRVILMGSSAGGHLALLHAFTANQFGWRSQDLADYDLRVNGVVALYPPVDLSAYLDYSPSGLAPGLLGGTPDEVPDMYVKYSPLFQVHTECPPTLILQGAHDYVVPVEPVRELHRRLNEAGCKSEYIEYPANEHGFDLFLPNISPAAKSAIGHVLRFAHQISTEN